MKRQLLTLSPFILLFLLTACQKEEAVSTENHFLFENCLAEVGLPENADETGFCGNVVADTSIYCNYIIAEEIFFLTEEEKSWLPFYCFEDGANVFYSNEEGDVISFLIEEHTSQIRTTGGYSFSCDDETKKSGFCFPVEEAFVRFRSLTLDWEAIILLRPYVSRFNTDILEKKGFTIFLRTDVDNLYHFQMTLQSPGIPSYLEFHDAIEIHGETFQDVYVYDNEWQEEALTVYYNRMYGIVSFIDHHGTQWRINK